MTEFRTEAQIRRRAIHYLDFRDLTADEVDEASENIQRLLAESYRRRVSESEEPT